MALLPSAPLAFGKLPGIGDFVRAGLRCSVLDSLDQWIQDGILESRRYGTFPEYTGIQERMGFVYSVPHVPEVLIGSLAMSHDRVGRRYPFFVAHATSQRGLDPRDLPFWPVVWSNAIESCADLIGKGAEMNDPSEPGMMIGRLPGIKSPADRAARHEHLLDLNRTTLGQFTESVWPENTALSSRHLFQRLLEVARPGRGAAAPTLGLSFPLPEENEGVSAVAVWLEIVRKLWPGRPEWPVVAWSLDPGKNRRLVVFPQGAPRKAFGTVVGLSADARLVVILDEPPGRITLPPVPQRYERLIERPDLPLAAFLAAL